MGENAKKLKEQKYFIACQSGLKNVLLRNQSEKSQIYFFVSCNTT